MMQPESAFVIQDFIKALEPVIRRVVREELHLLAGQQTGIFHLDPDSPLYADLTELKERRKHGGIEFVSHDEVWK